MSAKQPSALTVLWTAEAGSSTRELRITRATATACVVIVGALLGVCLWLGWELGHWSAKDGSSLASTWSTEANVAG